MNASLNHLHDSPAPGSDVSPVTPPADTKAFADGWIAIDSVEQMPPFLMTLSSEDNHWMFISSNGGLTAGREDPNQSLFPYQTEDKLTHSAHAIGPRSIIRWINADGTHRFWQPLHPHHATGPRSLHKKLDNTRLTFREQHPQNPWIFSATWGFSRRWGFIRKVSLHNAGDQPAELDLLDGLQGINPAGLDEAFQTQFSILAHAYTRCEAFPDTALRLVYLNSAPTDRAEPSESLRTNVVWSTGLRPDASLLRPDTPERFLRGDSLSTETETRGLRACPFNLYRLSLKPSQTTTFYWVAEVNQSSAKVHDLKAFLDQTPADSVADLMEQAWEENSQNLRAMIASADGLQHTADYRRMARHFSNALFNCQRGGVFLDGYTVPLDSLRRHLRTFNRPVAQRHQEWLESLPHPISRAQLLREAAATDDPDLHRLCLEFLPLTFSRRHGDPSRPWNKFHIRVRDRHGNRILSYQGNWRDIFQNWEALLYSFPDYAEGFVARFLNASTADGYNPYRLTSDGFDWEKLDPDEPWSNIGYWGDHQIVYLLRLLMGSRACNGDSLNELLQQRLFTYARVPYRIKTFPEVLADPRNSILFDEGAEDAIGKSVRHLGNDGKLLTARDGQPIRVNMAEKLLNPLFAKLANFVPGGGIWMNTQRPEWNDANNALAGYGLSVVTMAYTFRYLRFLTDWWSALPADTGFSLSTELAEFMTGLQKPFARHPNEMDETERLAFLRELFQAADRFRQPLYAQGLSGNQTTVPLSSILEFLQSASAWLAHSLTANQRDDNLFHSYNLLHIHSDKLAVGHLQPMLEGQVAILSAGLLAPEQAADVLQALRRSPLYRKDQHSYLLYPDRDLPSFLEKNQIPASELRSSPLLQQLANDPEQDLVELDSSGIAHFGPGLRNAGDLTEALAQLPESYQSLVGQEGQAAARLFEDLFQHHAFTGRSGTFFAYEGLGSIYWHMVSKLLMAIQENAMAAAAGESEAFLSLQNHYRDVLAGLGIHKSPQEYGAFPTDAYSHTPKHAGAQQPGMTGQVKEDLLVRMAELGVSPKNGRLHFHPVLLDRSEFITTESVFHYTTLDGEEAELSLSPHSLAFTFCQLPVVYTRGLPAGLSLHWHDQSPTRLPGNVLPQDLAQRVFQRDPALHWLHVGLPA